MPTKYRVTAVPFEGHAQFSRAGQTFGTEPTEITVLDEAPAEGAARQPGQVTAAEFEAIKAEPRLKVETMAGKPVEAKPASGGATDAPAAPEGERTDRHRNR